MGWRGTIALAAVLLVVAAYAYVDLASQDGAFRVETIFEPSPPTPPARAGALLAFDPDEVVAIDIRRGDERTQITRSETSWKGVAAPGVIDDFLATLLELSEILNLDVPANELADHGLDPPRTTITLARRAAPPLSIDIGSYNPPATGVYAQVGGRPEVVLTGALVLWEVEKVMKASRQE